MTAALCIWPGNGSVWLENIERFTDEDGHECVSGEAWDYTGVGSPSMPEWWAGETMPMWFPITYVLKWDAS